MTVTRDEVHELVDKAPAETLERVGRMLRRNTRDGTDERQASKQRLADAGILATPNRLDRERQDQSAVAAARARAGHGVPLSYYVDDERR